MPFLQYFRQGTENKRFAALGIIIASCHRFVLSPGNNSSSKQLALHIKDEAIDIALSQSK